MISRIVTYAGIGGMKLIARLPLALLYGLSDLLYVLVYHVAGYRKKVVRRNLERSFPEMEAAAIDQTMRDYYRYLCDILVESVKAGAMNGRQLSERMVFRNPEVVNRYFKEGKSVIIMALHYGNWEWLLHMPQVIRHHHYFVYKPLKNEIFDRHLNGIRARFGGEMVSMSIVLRKLLEAEKQKRPVLTWLAADQAPPWNHPSWTTFMHQKTIFFNGPAKLAHRFGHPVLFEHIRRISRGRYETWFEVLYEDPRQVSEETIIESYIRKAEAVIREEPCCYLWSHKRWKYPFPGAPPSY